MKEYFKNNKHTFKASINGSHIKIGGKSYNDCINVAIYNDTDNIPVKAKIPHLQSEPECSFDNILDNKDTVDFIKASLQYIHYKFPTIKIFEFDDMSHIDCGKTKSVIPPRKLDKPFSLAHLYLAMYGETWYENRFGAKMINKVLYNNYKEGLLKLNNKINIDYTVFKINNSINEKQDAILSKYYSKDKSWKEFFNDIPKDERCDSLFNWLQYYIPEIIENTYNPFGWYIDIETMPKTHMEIVDKPTLKGGAKTRKTKPTIRFTNKQYFDGNGFIFDGNDY